MSVTPSQCPDPLPPMAAALKAAFTSWAVEHPDQAGDLPGHWFSDPDKVEEWRQRDAEATRLRQALETGADPEELGLAHNGLERILAERGLS